MQIMYAAPFLLVAAICFFLALSTANSRRHALVIPFGVLAFGFSTLLFFVDCGLVGGKHLSPPLLFGVTVAGGLTASVVSSLIYRQILTILPIWAIRCGTVLATCASSFVLFVTTSLALNDRLQAIAHRLTTEAAVGWSVSTLVLVAWLSRDAEALRPRRLRAFPTSTPVG